MKTPGCVAACAPRQDQPRSNTIAAELVRLARSRVHASSRPLAPSGVLRGTKMKWPADVAALVADAKIRLALKHDQPFLLTGLPMQCAFDLADAQNSGPDCLPHGQCLYGALHEAAMLIAHDAEKQARVVQSKCGGRLFEGLRCKLQTLQTAQ
jgi:hypothetical protein